MTIRYSKESLARMAAESPATLIDLLKSGRLVAEDLTVAAEIAGSISDSEIVRPALLQILVETARSMGLLLPESEQEIAVAETEVAGLKDDDLPQRLREPDALFDAEASSEKQEETYDCATHGRTCQLEGGSCSRRALRTTSNSKDNSCKTP